MNLAFQLDYADGQAPELIHNTTIPDTWQILIEIPSDPPAIINKTAPDDYYFIDPAKQEIAVFFENGEFDLPIEGERLELKYQVIKTTNGVKNYSNKNSIVLQPSLSDTPVFVFPDQPVHGAIPMFDGNGRLIESKLVDTGTGLEYDGDQVGGGGSSPNAFDKINDNSDDITEGATNLFLTQSERDAILDFNPAVAWTPTDLGSKLDCRIEPVLGIGMLNASGNPAADGQKIATLNESIFSDSFTQSNDAKRPKYIAESEYSGTPCIRVDTTQTFLSNPTWNRWNNKNSQCWVIAWKPKGVTPSEIVQNPDSAAGQQSFKVYGASGNISVGSYEPSNVSFGNSFRSNGGLLLSVVHDGTLTGNANRLKLYKNKVQVAQTSASFPVPTQMNSSAPGLALFGQSGNSESGQGDYYMILHLNSAPTTDELNKIHDYAERTYFAEAKKRSNVYTDGDSRVEGLYAGVPIVPEFTYPTQLARILHGNSFDKNNNVIGAFDKTKLWNVYNCGIAGDKVTDQIQTQLINILRLRDEWLKNDIYALWGGYNDYFTGASGAAVKAGLDNIFDQVRDYGFKSIVFTEVGDGTDVNGDPPLEPAKRAQMTAGNNLLIGDNPADFLLRLDLNLRFAKPIFPSQFHDGSSVHLSADGNEGIAGLVYRAISAIGKI